MPTLPGMTRCMPGALTDAISSSALAIAASGIGAVVVPNRNLRYFVLAMSSACAGWPWQITAVEQPPTAALVSLRIG